MINISEGALSPGSEETGNAGDTELSSPTQNSTDEEKLIGMSHRMAIPSGAAETLPPFTLENRLDICTVSQAKGISGVR